jgi:hypothetical protein
MILHLENGLGRLIQDRIYRIIRKNSLCLPAAWVEIAGMTAQIRMIFAAAWAAVFLTACSADPSPTKGTAMTIQVSSPAFTDSQPIPQKYAHDNQNVSPALQWSSVPAAAKSLALICDDPDAPVGTWVHWVIYGLPPTLTNLPTGLPTSPELPDGSRQGMNDYKQIGYGGPQPPPGKPHRYFFKLYALDIIPDLKAGATKADLLKAMEGHIIAQGQLMGTYQR